jgi:hypothetical protein
MGISKLWRAFLFSPYPIEIAIAGYSITPKVFVSNEALFSQAQRTLTIINEQNITAETLAALHDGYLDDLIQALKQHIIPSRETFRNNIGLPPLQFHVTVDCSVPLREKITANRYHWVNAEILPELLQAEPDGQWESSAQLIHFYRTISSEDALAEIEHKGCRPARIEELVAFGIAFPNVSQMFPIVALGSTCELEHVYYSPYIESETINRKLDFARRDSIWAVCCRFSDLVVRP